MNSTKPQLFNLAAISASGTVLTGLLWLLAYSLNHTDGIGFDGPAWGILLYALIAGWLASSAFALVLYRRKPASGNIVLTLATLIITGIIVGLATGYCVATYAQNHYPDGGFHLVEWGRSRYKNA